MPVCLITNVLRYRSKATKDSVLTPKTPFQPSAVAFHDSKTSVPFPVLSRNRQRPWKATRSTNKQCTCDEVLSCSQRSNERFLAFAITSLRLWVSSPRRFEVTPRTLEDEGGRFLSKRLKPINQRRWPHIARDMNPDRSVLSTCLFVQIMNTKLYFPQAVPLLWLIRNSGRVLWNSTWYSLSCVL